MTTKTLVDTDSVQDLVNKGALGIGVASPARLLEIKQNTVGVPQVRLSGATNNEMTELRCGGSGGDPSGNGGDFFVHPSGSTIWYQTSQNNFPTTIEIVPKGTMNTNAGNLELWGTDCLADGVNYKRLKLSANGSTGNEHEITSDHGGSVAALPLHIYVAGSNGLYLKSDGLAGLGTMTPRRRFDILGNYGPQLRLSYSDNSVYWDIETKSTHELELTPSDAGSGVIINGKLTVAAAMKIEVVATASLPGATSSQDGRILIEDAGAGDRNLIIYAGGQRFRIDGGTAF